jgi:hypothetical protein
VSAATAAPAPNTASLSVAEFRSVPAVTAWMLAKRKSGKGT